MSSLDMDTTVMAAVRFGSHVKHLGGAHMGPYMIQARPKTPKDASAIEIVLCTDARFFDASGKVAQPLRGLNQHKTYFSMREAACQAYWKSGLVVSLPLYHFEERLFSSQRNRYGSFLTATIWQAGVLCRKFQGPVSQSTVAVSG